MPANIKLPRGCSSSRGGSHIRHNASLGGEQAREVNRLYMLTVRRESLMCKKRSLEGRLVDINQQLGEIERERTESETKFDLLRGKEYHRKRKGRRPLPAATEGWNGTKRLQLDY